MNFNRNTTEQPSCRKYTARGGTPNELCACDSFVRLQGNSRIITANDTNTGIEKKYFCKVK
jgi:hypothetical protein